MAYLILEDDVTGNETAYFEFDPENGATIDKIESLLALRKSFKDAGVAQLNELAGKSMELKCDCRKRSGVAALFGDFLSLFSGKKHVRQPKSCRCGNRSGSHRFTNRITPETLSLAS